MRWRWPNQILTFCLLATCLIAAVFSEYMVSMAGDGWLRALAVEMRAACRDSSTQWMVFLCAGIYLITFTVLAGRISGRQFWRVGNPDVWLSALMGFVTITYFLGYQQAGMSTQPLLLLTAAALGKGVSMWVAFPKTNNETERRAKSFLVLLILTLAAAALWQPVQITEYQYREIHRWSGAWENPNIYGLLMAVGLVLAVGLCVSGVRHQVSGMKAEHSTFNVQHSTSIGRLLRGLTMLLFAGAAVLCGFGLLKSYSRGAWLGAAIGLAYLIWQWSKAENRKLNAEITVSGKQRTTHHAPRTSRFCFPLSHFPLFCPLLVILLSVVILSFWQFRHTEWPPARRVFSVTNINDFSWRNRVTAWQGALQMMTDRPLLGFGWGKAEEAYRTDYRAPRLEETAAIQMNDYLMLGISAGVPALLCFVVCLALSFRQMRGHPPSSILNLPSSPVTYCRAGALVLITGFWFDGGLFKLPTAAVFWMVMELGRLRSTDESERRFPNRLAAADTLQFAGSETGAPHCAKSVSSTAIRWLAGVFACAALIISGLHLITPRLPVSQRTLGIARNWLVQPAHRNDFDFLAAKPIWDGKTLNWLLEHVRLTRYNRELIGWKVDDKHYLDFELSPQVDPAFDGDMNWRRPLWEHLFPRVRRETDPQAAAEIVLKQLHESVRIVSDTAVHADIESMWELGSADAAGIEALRVAALRSVGIPARLGASGQTELWTGVAWVPALRPTSNE